MYLFNFDIIEPKDDTKMYTVALIHFPRNFGQNLLRNQVAALISAFMVTQFFRGLAIVNIVRKP